MANNRKPSAVRDLEGNRSRRSIPKELPLQGLPVMPTNLNEAGEKFWKLVAGELGAVGVAKRIDGPALAQAAEVWQLAQDAFEGLTITPDDKGLQNAYCKYVSQWLKLSARLGLTPADRARLTVAATEEPDAT